jgi:hypothetical protein
LGQKIFYFGSKIVNSGSKKSLLCNGSKMIIQYFYLRHEFTGYVACFQFQLRLRTSLRMTAE